MKIKDLNSATVFKRCLAAKQLDTYANLRIVMDDFNTLNIQEEERNRRVKDFVNVLDENLENENQTSHSPNRISALIKTYLPFAARGDSSFLDKPEFKEALENFRPSIQDRIIKNFENYTNYSITYSNFKFAETSLDECFEPKKDGSIALSTKKLKSYQERILKKSEDLEKFAIHFAKHSPTFLKHEGFVISKNAFAKIGRVQPKENLPKSFSNITPGTFDANIRGFYRSKEQEETKEYFSEYKNKQASRFSEAIYGSSIGKHHTRKFTGDKANIRRIIKTAAIFGICAFMTYESFSYFNELQDINIDNSTPTVSSSTLEKIRSIENDLITLGKSNQLPTEEQISKITNALDDNNNDIISDLVTNAVEKEKPDWSVNFVDISYDDITGDGNKVTFEYKDEDGHTQTKKIKNPMDYTLSQAFQFERSLDSKTEYEQLFDKAFDKNNNFVERSRATVDLIDFLNDMLEHQKNMAALEINYSDNWIFPDSLGFVIPSKVADQSLEQDSAEKNTSTHEQIVEDDDYTR